MTDSPKRPEWLTEDRLNELIDGATFSDGQVMTSMMIVKVPVDDGHSWRPVAAVACDHCNTLQAADDEILLHDQLTEALVHDGPCVVTQ